MTKHAVLSPSGFKALMLCPGKPAMEMDLPDSSSKYADEGTAAHFLAAWCLTQERAPTEFLGRGITVNGEATWAREKRDANTFEVTEEMTESVQTYIDTIAVHRIDGGQMSVEVAVPLSHITGEKGATGTADVVVIRGTEMIVGDFKYGRGVEVDAKDNPQLKLYALGALHDLDLVGDIETCRVFISQPRINPVASEWSYTVAELKAWAANEAATASDLAWDAIQAAKGGTVPDVYLRPAADACRFCRAKASCPKLAQYVSDSIEAEFTDLTTTDATARAELVSTRVNAAEQHLGAKLDAVEVIELWCKAIRARVEARLLEGVPVAGYKLVNGRRDARTWTDAHEVEQTFKSMRLKQEEMFDFSLISPTTAEKRLKDQPKRWARVSALITQPEGKPSVAPVSDKRAAIDLKAIESEITNILVDDLV